MKTIYDLGSVLYWPFDHIFIGQVIWLISIIVAIVLAKKQHLVKKFLLGWFLGIPIMGVIYIIIGTLAHEGSSGFLSDASNTTGANPLLVIACALLWFLYFPIIGANYLFFKRTKESITSLKE